MNDNVEQSDPVTLLEGQVWALAAVVATLRETGTSSLEEALAADPARTAVLEAAGLVRRGGGRVTVPPPRLAARSRLLQHGVRPAQLDAAGGRRRRR